ncbi:MAG: exodeoxyribonuclease VII large subunit, partial [Methanosarcinales archaeon]
KSIKDQLDESISYEEIRCVLAFVKSQVQLDKQKKSTNNAFERELTDSAKHILKEKIPINLHLLAKNEIVPKPENLGILSELKTWRKNIASEKNIPPYCVFHDSTLISIANQLPKTKKELKMIKGVGIRKIESYGEDILKITSGYDQLASISNSRIREIKTYNRELHEKVKKETPESLKLEIFTVGELTKYIKNLLESDRNLTNLWVRGEISNLRQHASGHIYFSLKDEESQIRCVIFRRVGDYLNFKLEHGMKIVVRGNVEVYEPYGEYSIIIEEVQPDGLGALNLAFIVYKV